MVRLMEGEQECNNRTQTSNIRLRQDKRTGTFWSHVVEGAEEFAEPGLSVRFLRDAFRVFNQGLGRDLSCWGPF